MRIFRVECRAHGVGPYRSLHPDYSPQCDCGSHPLSMIGRSPVPDADPGIGRGMLPDERCAFADLAQLNQWFGLYREDARSLAYGLSMWCIAEYMAQTTAVGEYQVLYLAHRAIRVDRWAIPALVWF